MPTIASNRNFLKYADEELDTSEMMSMLRFGASCCFSADAGAPPSDQELEAIIDRTRTEADSVGGLVGGKQHTAASFDASTQASPQRPPCSGCASPQTTSRKA